MSSRIRIPDGNLITSHSDGAVVQHPDVGRVRRGGGIESFGDIPSPISGRPHRTVGSAPAANLNPERELCPRCSNLSTARRPIGGKAVANPSGNLVPGRMILNNLGHRSFASHRSRHRNVASMARCTRDLGGTATTPLSAAPLRGRVQRLGRHLRPFHHAGPHMPRCGPRPRLIHRAVDACLEQSSEPSG